MSTQFFFTLQKILIKNLTQVVGEASLGLRRVLQHDEDFSRKKVKEFAQGEREILVTIIEA